MKPFRRTVHLGALACRTWVLLLLAGCGGDEPAPPPEAPAPAQRTQVTAAPDAHLPVLGRAPWFELTDSRMQAVDAGALRGKVWLANFMFTSCQATCPTQAAHLALLQERTAGLAQAADLRFLSFTVDPERDTPGVLARYGAEHGADPARWWFLTGERPAIWRLSTRGFKLPAGEDPTNEAMPIAHSAKFALVDRVGRIRGYYDGMDPAALEPLQADIECLLQVPPARWVSPPLPDWIGPRAQAQAAAVAASKVDHDFGFRNVQAECGLRFRHRFVDDAGKEYKPVHYDHGNAVAVADVDGDGLLDVFFSNQVGSNRLFANLGDGQFTDITVRAGIAQQEAIGVAASFADVDNDGDADLFVTNVMSGNALFLNDGSGTFSDVTATAGVAGPGHASAAVFFDYDRDGLLDLLVTYVGVYTTDTVRPVTQDIGSLGAERYAATYREGVKDGFSGHLKPARREPSRLYRNLGGARFEDVSTQVGFQDASWSGAATPIDIDDDGWLDLYLLDMQGHDEVWMNRAGRRFTKASRQVFPRTPWGSMGVKVFDLENDGDLDLYVTDMHSDMSRTQDPEEEKTKSTMDWPESMTLSEGQSIWGNALYRKTGPSTYEEISDAFGAETYWPWGISVGDLNADGFDDVFVTAGMSFPYRYGINSVLLNEGGRRFVDAEFVLGVEPRHPPLDRPWFELDCQGAEAGQFLCEPGDGHVIVESPISSRSSVVFDLDGDGDLDVVTNDFGSEPLVLLSDLAARRTVRRLVVRLEGTRSNRDGLGAVVRVTAGALRRTKVHDGLSGYLAQSSMPLWFGLGNLEAADRVEVVWPSGARSVVEGPIALDAPLLVREAPADVPEDAAR